MVPSIYSVGKWWRMVGGMVSYCVFFGVYGFGYWSGICMRLAKGCVCDLSVCREDRIEGCCEWDGRGHFIFRRFGGVGLG